MNQFRILETRTDGIALRPLGAQDVQAVAAACNDDLVQRWLPLPRPDTVGDAENWCLRLSHELRDRGDGLNLAVATESGDFVGCVSRSGPTGALRVTELGYWTDPQMRSAGYMATATAFLARWALTHGMERVELTAATGNLASQRVAEKAGFSFEGIMRNAGIVHGGRVDLRLYALTSDRPGVADLVSEFHALLGPGAPTAQQTAAWRRAMLAEEYREHEAAEEIQDLDAVLAEVHASNMTRQPPASPGGKAIKGPGYRPPDIGLVLRDTRPATPPR